MANTKTTSSKEKKEKPEWFIKNEREVIARTLEIGILMSIGIIFGYTYRTHFDLGLVELVVQCIVSILVVLAFAVLANKIVWILVRKRYAKKPQL